MNTVQIEIKTKNGKRTTISINKTMFEIFCLKFESEKEAKKDIKKYMGLNDGIKDSVGAQSYVLLEITDENLKQKYLKGLNDKYYKEVIKEEP